ncbi:MAG TPA: carbohydrate porin [Chthoniobacterales bacterium]|nr:carbohydrate porin [Chthoniobacterales bacterium]
MRKTSSHLNYICWFALPALSLLGAPMARGDDESLSEFKAKIEAEVNAIKQNYETKIQGLENRVETLESENAQLKQHKSSTTSNNQAPEVAALKQRVIKLEQTKTETAIAAAPNETAQPLAPDPIRKIQTQIREDATETRDIYKQDWPFDVAKLYELPRPFEFHGYLRSGFGMNGEDGKMVAFQAPGAGAKYRLGNEADTYGEFALVNNWLRTDDPSKAPYVKTTVRISYSTGENFSYDSLNNQVQGNDIALREAFVEAGNVFQSIPEIRFWAGQRYYQRHDIHINDFFYLDMSGYGGGVEDIPVGDFAKLDAAWIGGSVDNYVTDHGNVAKQNLDLRLTDIKVLSGKLTLWLDLSHTRGGDVRNVFDPNGNPIAIESSSGWAVGLIHRTNEPTAVATDDGKGGTVPSEKTQGGFLGGYNDFSIQYGSGAAYNFASTLDTSGPNLDEAWRFRVTDHFTIQPWDRFAMQAVGIYEETEFGGPNSHQRWGSLGARPIYYFSDRFSIALEAGIDWAKSEPLGTDGHLWKITLAPQISRGGKFFDRPVLRAFVTYAKWSDGFKGLVGGTPYQNDTEGLTYGLQVETWW